MDKAFAFRGTINPFKIINHPIDTIEALKEKKNGSIFSATIILAIFTISEIILDVMKGFIQNTSRIQDFNVIMVLVRSLFMVLLFVVANWALCTLLNCEGRMIDIYISICYCLIPLVIARVVETVASNILTADEYVFVDMIVLCLNLWFVCLALFALKTIHNYSLGRTIFNVIITLIGMAIIFFIIFLFVVLMQQLYIFIATIVTELMMR